jgi:hypothetical protein
MLDEWRLPCASSRARRPSTTSGLGRREIICSYTGGMPTGRKGAHAQSLEVRGGPRRTAAVILMFTSCPPDRCSGPVAGSRVQGSFDIGHVTQVWAGKAIHPHYSPVGPELGSVLFGPDHCLDGDPATLPEQRAGFQSELSGAGCRLPSQRGGSRRCHSHTGAITREA